MFCVYNLIYRKKEVDWNKRKLNNIFDNEAIC